MSGRFLARGAAQRVWAPVSLRLLRALVAATAPLGVMELVHAVYGPKAAPTARHSIDTLLRRIEKSGVAIERPNRGFCRLAEVSRETVVSILERQGAVLTLADEVADPGLVSIIDEGLRRLNSSEEAAA
jgi:hypothetical protein